MLDVNVHLIFFLLRKQVKGQGFVMPESLNYFADFIQTNYHVHKNSDPFRNDHTKHANKEQIRKLARHKNTCFWRLWRSNRIDWIIWAFFRSASDLFGKIWSVTNLSAGVGDISVSCDFLCFLWWTEIGTFIKFTYSSKYISPSNR